MGMQVFADTDVKEIQASTDSAVLVMASGAQLTAKSVIFATGYEPIVKLPREFCRLRSTYALASEKQASFADWPGRCMIWEAARPYLYMRTTQDDRIIIGGADVEIVDPHGRDALLDEKTRELCERFGKMFPDIAIEVACAWAGTFAQTRDGLPYIGSLP